MKSKLQTFKVYSDQKSVVMLEDEDHVLWLAKTSLGEEFSLLRGARTAWVRRMFGWEHPQTKAYMASEILDKPLGTLITTSTIPGMLKDIKEVPHWLFIDFFSQIPETKASMIFIPA